MPESMGKSLREYLKDLEGGREGKPEQVREGIETYLGLWHRAVDKGVADLGDDVAVALEKVERAGGLYRAGED